MIVTKRIALRIALIIAAAVVVQVSFLSFLTPLGATPTLIPVVVVSLGLLGGAVFGAVCGFAAGLLLDAVMLQTLGVSSLVLLSIGYLAGRYRESFEITSPLLPALLASGFTLLASLGFAALHLLLGIEAPVSLLVLREILLQALYAIVLALVAYPLIRRILAPALVNYTPSHRILVPGLARRPRRRRRAAGTAGAPAAGAARSGRAGNGHRGRRRGARRRSAPQVPGGVG